MTTPIRTLAQGSRLALLLAAALSLPACVVETQPYHPHGPYGDRGPVDRIDGFVTFEGRCPTIRDHQSNQIFALAGNTRALQPGDHVLLRERVTDRNACGSEAPTLEVLGIDAVWKGDGHDSPYYESRRDGDFDSFLAQNRELGGWYADRYAYLNGGGRPGRNDRGDRDGDRRDRDRGYDNGVPPVPPLPPNNPSDPNDRYAAPPDQPPVAPPAADDDRDRGRDMDRNTDRNTNRDMDRDDDRNDEHESLRVDGRLDFGGSCPAIHTPDGNSYDLAGDLGNYHDGDQVRVIGVLQGRSSCGGRTLEVNEIQSRRR